MVKDFYDGMTLDEIYTKRIKYNSPVLERLSTLESILKNIKVQFTGNYNDLTNKPDLTIYAVNSEIQGQLDSIGISISDIEKEISEVINVELARLETDKVDYTDGNIDLADGKTYKINNVDVIGDKAKVDASNLTSGNVDSWQEKLGYERVETVYDKDNASATYNWGYTSGIANNTTVSGKDFSKYRYLRCYSQVYAVLHMTLIDLTKLSANNNYPGLDLFWLVQSSTIFGKTEILVNSAKTSITFLVYYENYNTGSQTSDSNYYFYKIEGVY